MKKKLLSIFLASIMVLSLSACGAKEESNAVKIGVSLSMTGQLSVYGEAMQNAIKMAIEEINADGGVLGGRDLVVTDYLDDKGDSAEAGNAMNRLISSGVSAVIGSVSSSVTAGMTTLAHDNNMLLITATATNDDITTGKPTVFRACYADSYQSGIVAKFMKESLGVTKVAVLYASADAYSAGMYQGFKKAAEELGLEIICEESTSNTSDTDFNTQWANIKASGAEAVFAPFYYDAVGPYVIPQARQNGYTGAIVGADGFDGTENQMVGDKADYNNVFFTNHYAADDPSELVQNFVKNYKEKYGVTPNALAALAYDTTYMLRDAINKANSDETAKIVEALTGMSFTGVTGSFVLDENNTPAKPCAIIEIKDGVTVWRDTIG